MASKLVILTRILGVLAALSVACVLLVLYGTCLQPRLDAAAFKRDWVARFQDYCGSGEIPPAWAEDVCVRRIGPDAWVLAAMYHGVCAPGPQGCFDASVFLDSKGRISTSSWSPCAGELKESASAWADYVPATSLDEFYRNLERRGEVEVVVEKAPSGAAK